MSFAAAARRKSAPSPRKKRSPLAIALIVVAALVVLLLLLAQFWTEVMWFTQVGYSQVIWTEWGTRAALFVAGFLVMAGLVFWSFSAAYRVRPVYAPSTPEQATLDQYREAIEPLRKIVMIVVPALVGFFAGAAAAAQWKNVLLAINGVSFGVKDPQYGIDLSFYVFTLPVIRFVVSFLMAVVIVAGIAALATHYLYGGLRIGGGAGQGKRTTPGARVQLAVLAAVLMLLVAGNYWLDRYSILTTGGSRFSGASYADVNAVIPSKAILAFVAVFVAALFVVTAIRGNWRLPAIGVGLLLVSAISIGGIYPAVVQRFQVAPNAQDKEAEYIQRNIDATRKAYGIDNVKTEQYAAKTQAEAGALRADAETTASIRLLDPQIVSPSFRQLQQNKQYYNFADTLAVDRYTVDGESKDTVIAVRELDQGGLGPEQRNWVNDHTVYTHGYGVVAAYGNQIGPDGRPAFYEGDIPSAGAFTKAGGYEPRIYFSPAAPNYSIVGAPKGTDPWELDYPTDEVQGGQVNSTFPTQTISAGPKLSGLFSKVLFSLKFGSEQILFSDRVNADSQILYVRNPRERVAKVAPYLTLDGRVYPAVVDGRVKWIVDGYTTTNNYPYSTSRPLDEATADSLVARSGAIQALAPQQVNYIRNSVKATVDAYDGSVHLYAWEPNDPILKTWSKVFPSSVKPMSEISGSLMSHMRYPEDLFKVQRTLLAKYHVTDAREFFSGQDYWRSPADPTAGDNATSLQPPYYLTLQMPSQKTPTFSLTSTFIPGGTSDRNILTGFLAADAEAGNTPGKRSEDYGTLRLLELPRNATVPGPGQVQNKLNTTPEITSALTLLKDSTIIRGNLLTLPVGGGLLYVQPLYVQSKEGTKFPLLRKVMVSFGNEVGFADTLDEALDQVFGGDSGAAAGDAGNAGSTTEEPAPDTEEPTKPATGDGESGTVNAEARAALDQALRAAQQAIEDGQAALAKGDFAAYGAAQERLDEALRSAVAAERRLDAASADK